MPRFLRWSNLLFAFVPVLLFSALCWGQKDTGSIVGMVKDPSGATIADACVAGTFYNTYVFSSDLVQGTYGDEGRNVVRGPGYQNWDLTLGKTFPIREQMRFEFRADFFNIWNHTNYQTGPVGSDGQFEPVAVELGTSQMGFPQSARDPRLVQFAVKFLF